MSKTILVVDDEKRLVSLVESYLAQEGYRVVTAHNGKEALTAARRDKPDLIVLDVMMPDGSIAQRATHVRNSSAFYQTRLAIISSQCLRVTMKKTGTGWVSSRFGINLLQMHSCSLDMGRPPRWVPFILTD